MQTIKTPIYQSKQIREFEQLAQERFSLSAHAMMQRAGKAAFDFLVRRWPQAQNIAIFCGMGNNGGDGYVLAELAHERGLHVTLWQVGDMSRCKAEVKIGIAACQKAGIAMKQFVTDADLGHPELIVDAICGIGVQDDLRDDVLLAVERIQRLSAPIFAIDIPTGIAADTGEVLGAALYATATITFIGLKIGLLTGSGIAHTGELILNNLQLPTELFSYVTPIAEKTYLNCYASYLKPRLRDWHKGLSGHVLIIGGDQGYSGAPRMAAEAALRVGAGLVTVATHPEHVTMFNITRPEIMCYGVSNEKELSSLLARADVIVIGPGLGQSAWSKMLWSQVRHVDLPLVVDADGLNLLAQAPEQCEHWVLTPHPGEAARLLQLSPAQVQQNRLLALEKLRSQYRGVCVLKGAGTWVAAPHILPTVCDKGNPGMATAGMGDVLSGVIGGLIAQKIPLADAAQLGVCLHAAAGDLAAKDGERGMIATDLMPYLRRLSNQ